MTEKNHPIVAGPYLFTGREGPLKKRQIQNLFNHSAKAAGISGRSVHSLRHSIAVHLLDAGRLDAPTKDRMSETDALIAVKCAAPSGPRRIA